MFQNFSIKNMKMTKKAELTTQQIITITIILISFIVLLYFLFLLNPGETSSKQICYNSVVLSDKGSGLVGNLDCKTSYLCLSGGDLCTDFNPTSTVKVDVSKKEETLKAIADEMTDCWWMFGEGKIDYVSAGLIEEGQEVFDASAPYHCAICSRLKFDDKIRESINEITYPELYEYMRTHQSPHDTSQSYLRYLYGVNSIESSNMSLKEFNLNLPPILTSKDYIIITGQDPELLASNKYKKVQVVSTDEAATKTMCGAFDITQA